MFDSFPINAEISFIKMKILYDDENINDISNFENETEILVKKIEEEEEEEEEKDKEEDKEEEKVEEKEANISNKSDSISKNIQ